MKFINESVYWHGKGRICNCVNRLLHEALGCVQVKILRIFFYTLKIFPLSEEWRCNGHALWEIVF